MKGIGNVGILTEDSQGKIQKAAKAKAKSQKRL
jgi:hypothetical protein